MIGSNSYYTLVASLPAMPRHFEVDRVPITQSRLEKRLEMLEPRDVRAVEQLREFLLWDRQPPERTDDEMIAHYHRIMATTTNRLARHMVEYRMDIRTIMSGLRRRRRNLPPPPGVGQWTEHIRRNWEHPEFKLQWRYPWITQVNQLLGTTDSLALERILLGITWKHWTKLNEYYFFSFEAVLVYLARWEIIHRWVGRNVEIGRQRFEQLVTETLNEYSNLYA